MWDLPGPGLEPVSPALPGRFLTTVPSGKSLFFLYSHYNFNFFTCLLAVDWDSNTMLNKNSDGEDPYLVADFKRKAFIFFSYYECFVESFMYIYFM